MSLILDLPDILMEILFAEWLEYKDFVNFDSALCSKKSRAKFEAFIIHPRLNLNTGKSYRFRFPVSQKVILTSSLFVRFAQYCQRRQVQFAHLSLSIFVDIEWQEGFNPVLGLIQGTGNISKYDPYLQAVESLELAVTSKRTADVKFFYSVQELISYFQKFNMLLHFSLSFHGSVSLPFHLLFTQICSTFSHLTDISIQSYSGKFIEYFHPLSTATTSMATAPSVPASTYLDISNSFFHTFRNQLRVLLLPNMDLDVTQIYKIFLDIGMPCLETLQLPLRHAPWSSKYGGTRFNPYTKIMHRLNANQPVAGDDEEEEEAEDDSDYQQLDTSISSWTRIRIYKRPRVSCVSNRKFRVRDFDDFCQLFFEVPSTPLSNLKKLSGNYMYIYPILPLLGGSLESLRISLTLSRNDFEARTSVADSLFNQQSPYKPPLFSNLTNVKDLSILIVGQNVQTPLNTWNFGVLLHSIANSLQKLSLQAMNVECTSNSTHNFIQSYLPYWISSVPVSVMFPSWHEWVVSEKLISNKTDTEIVQLYSNLLRRAPHLSSCEWCC